MVFLVRGMAAENNEKKEKTDTRKILKDEEKETKNTRKVK